MPYLVGDIAFVYKGLINDESSERDVFSKIQK